MEKAEIKNNKIFMPTQSAEDWNVFFADPDKQWKSGYSAKALAYCWEEAGGFPRSVEKVFKESAYPVFKKITPLIILPEYKVPLPGGRRPSQSDIFIIAHSSEGLVTIAVEGKVEEPFGPTVSEWLQMSTQGKSIRLEHIMEQLDLTEQPPDKIRYQLLYRTASALIEAKWFHAKSAMLLVHSFSQNHKWSEDYSEFLNLFDKIGKPNTITLVGKKNGIDLYCAWVTGEEKYLKV